jgi:predicted ABC-type transport system involved in lysophospholipase L1 biosynthesis ATPase subunit
VIDNVALPLREMRALPDDLICRASLLKLQLVGLSAKDADKMPSDLSGGMIKRVGWPARWRWSRSWCSWTNPPPASTRWPRTTMWP